MHVKLNERRLVYARRERSRSFQSVKTIDPKSADFVFEVGVFFGCENIFFLSIFNSIE
jgi:hypothetical protein